MLPRLMCCIEHQQGKKSQSLFCLINSERMNFFWQCHKLKCVAESQFVKVYEKDKDREVTLNCNTPEEQQQRNIYINNSLIQENRKLLKEASDKTKIRNIWNKN